MKEKTTLLFLSNQKALQEAILHFHPDETYFKPFLVVPEVKGIWGHLGTTSNLILFYATSQFNLPERLLLKELRTKKPGIHLVLIAPEAVALAAWKFDLFHFIPFPATHQDIEDTLRKHIRITSSGALPKLAIRDQSGTTQWDLQQLLYCRGDGNYTHLHFIEGQHTIITKKLKEMQSSLAPYAGIERIGKSFIINLNNIKRIEPNGIQFMGQETIKLSLSDTYTKRIKDLLFGIDL